MGALLTGVKEMNRQNKKWILGKTALLALIALAFLLPLVWMITSSLKSTTEVFAVDWHWLPEQCAGTTMQPSGQIRR